MPHPETDQLTLFQPGLTDYAHLITTGTPRFSDLPTALLEEKIYMYIQVQGVRILSLVKLNYKVLGISILLQHYTNELKNFARHTLCLDTKCDALKTF